MKHITFLVYLSFLFSMTFHDDLISMTFNDETLDKPFVGGFNRPKIQWLDWDVDGDVDLFLLDASGYMHYFDNEGTPTSPDFKLITPMFQDIFCGGWFYFADHDGDGDMDLAAQHIENPNNVTYFQNNDGELIADQPHVSYWGAPCNGNHWLETNTKSAGYVLKFSKIHSFIS